MGVSANQQLRWEMEQSRKNREAEEAHARRVVWGGGEADKSEDDMGDNIILGDITETHTHQPSPPSKAGSIAKTVAAAGLAAAGIGAGAAAPIAAWRAFGPDTVIEQTDTDTDTQYGLRIFRDAAE